jgi:hypothetical protein
MVKSGGVKDICPKYETENCEKYDELNCNNLGYIYCDIYREYLKNLKTRKTSSLKRWL